MIQMIIVLQPSKMLFYNIVNLPFSLDTGGEFGLCIPEGALERAAVRLNLSINVAELSWLRVASRKSIILSFIDLASAFTEPTF